MWSCQHCTLHNEPSTTVCSLCGNIKPSDKDGRKGKGRVLRPRGPNGAVSSNLGEGSSSEEDMEEDFVSTATDKQFTSRRVRSRSMRTGKEGHPGGSCSGGPDRDAHREHVASLNGAVSFQNTGGASGSMGAPSSGRQHQPVELDGTDVSDADYCLADESSRGDILLFGRGWSNRGRYSGQSMMARRRDQCSPVRRGTKRRRPVPSTPSEAEITSWGVHACASSASGEDCRPLVPPPRRERIWVADSTLWKWPPRLRFRVDLASSPSTGASGGNPREGPEAVKDALAASSSCLSDPCTNGVRGSDGEVLPATGVACNRSTEGGAGTDDVATLTTYATPGGLHDAAESPKQQQGKKPQKKRSRLSLPKRANDDRTNSSPQPSSPAPGEASAGTTSEGTGLHSPDVLGPAATPTKLNQEAESREDEGEDGEDSPNAMDTCSMDDGEEGKRMWNVGVLVPGSQRPAEAKARSEDVDGSLARRPSSEGASADTSGVGSPLAAMDDPSSNAGPDSGEEIAKNLTKPAASEAKEVPKTVSKAVSSLNPPSARMPRRSMVMCMEDDSDSESGQEEETRAPPQVEKVHAGAVSNGAPSRPSSDTRSTQPDDAASQAPTRTSPGPIALDGDGGSVGSPPAPATSVDNGHVNVDVNPEASRSAREESPEPSMTGLVNTPSPSPQSGAAENVAVRKLAVSGKRSESSASALVLSRRTRSSDRAPTTRSTSRRGEWSCGQCTLLNRARAKSCSACEAPKPSKSRKTMAPAPLADGILAEAKGGESRLLGSGLGGEQPQVYEVKESAMDEEGRDGAKVGSGCGAPGVPKNLASNGDQNGHGKGGKLGENGASEAANVLIDEIEPISSDGDMVSDEDVVAYEEDSYDDDDGDDDEESNEDGDDDNDGDWRDYEDEDFDDGDDYEQGGDYEMEQQALTSSQIEKIYLDKQCARKRTSPTRSPSSKRQRKTENPGGEILDLTDVADDGEEPAEQRLDSARSSTKTRRNHLDEQVVIEDISDDDDDDLMVSVGRPADGARAKSSSPPRKFRFFASVKEHRDRGTSCVDFARLEATPCTSESYTKSYEARRKAREAKASKSKRGKKGRATRATGAGRGTRKVGTSASVATTTKTQGRRLNGSNSGRKSSGQALGATSGLSSGWIPAGVRDANGTSSTGGRAGSSKPSAVVAKKSAARQPFNHYQRSDEVVEDLGGAGGLHWEHAGRSTFGD